MRKLSFRQYLTPADLKKVIAYHLHGRGKVKGMTFSANTVIFKVFAEKDETIHYITEAQFMDAQINKNGILVVTFGMSSGHDLMNILNEISFFQHDEKSREKMKYPVIKLKKEWEI